MKKTIIFLSIVLYSIFSYAQWTAMPLPTNTEFNSIFFTDENTGYIVGGSLFSNARVFKTGNGGTS